ncbi:unnamed protein product [Trichogramma brassicae]|uniref:Uncharacterized protein n=1 Tax=Trichogramma brassicae TaxID=86971 RepID=A0A6H5J2D3_9HYME|nr:unnamed protein product [Trichogramma brassicae]
MYRPRTPPPPYQLVPSGLESQLKIVKLFQQWNLSFSGEENHLDRAEFYVRLQLCRSSVRGDVPDGELLRGLPIVFRKGALAWFWMNRNKFDLWVEFSEEFHEKFLKQTTTPASPPTPTPNPPGEPRIDDASPPEPGPGQGQAVIYVRIRAFWPFQYLIKWWRYFIGRR